MTKTTDHKTFTLTVTVGMTVVLFIVGVTWRAAAYLGSIKQGIADLNREFVTMRKDIQTIADDQWELRLDAKTGEGEFSRKSRVRREAVEAKREEVKEEEIRKEREKRP